jgi:hypothetical protein
VFKQNFSRLFRWGGVIGLALLTSWSAQSMSLTTYRIYMDNDNTTASFIMFNREEHTETCQLSLIHKNFTENGKMLSVDDDIVPSNSAKPWLRYSPRSFTAGPRSSQTIRFTLRRKVNTQAAEYRSYMKVLCDVNELVPLLSKATEEQAVLGMKPRLVLQVPIIARTGKLEAEVGFRDVQLDNEMLSFTLHRQGNRSVYGKLQLINKKSNEVFAFTDNISVYTESQQRSHEFPTGGIPANQLALRFVEDEKYGGSITYQQDVVLK